MVRLKHRPCPITCAIFFFLALSTTRLVLATEEAVLLTPAQGSEVIGKKPFIACRILKPFIFDTLVVMLDRTDISGVLEVSDQGFSYRPEEILPAGEHRLSVIGTLADGEPFEAEFTFSSRHFKHIEEAYSENELTVVYDQVLDKKDGQEPMPYWKVESNLASRSMLGNRGVDLSLVADMRYLGQQSTVNGLEQEEGGPLKRGLDLIDYLLTASYVRNRVRFSAELGDTSVDESLNTVSSLNRRGGKATLEVGPVTLGGFMVDGKETYGFEGLGLYPASHDHILGASGSVALLGERLQFKTIYVNGGENNGRFFGTWSEDGPRKGDVVGVMLTSDFFDQRLISDFEFDFSDFDPDTTDELGAISDKAYRFKMSGTSGKYTYEAMYEYMGPDYQVIGNQDLERDKQGFSLGAGAQFESQALQLYYTQYHDNVDDDVFYPTIRTCKGTLEYTFEKFEQLPVSFTYEKALVESTDEPSPSDETRSDTDTFSLNTYFTADHWSLGLEASYSDQDDKGPSNSDTRLYSLALSPVLTLDWLSISTSLEYQKTQDLLNDSDTDTYKLTLDFQGRLPGHRVSYEMAATWDRSLSRDGLTDQASFSGNGRLAYLLGENAWGHLNPSVGIKVLYGNTHDRVLGERIESYAVMLSLETSIPFAY